MSSDLSVQSNWLKKHTRVIVGVLFLLAVPWWLYVGVPEQLEIPTNFSLKTNVDSFDNFYNAETKAFGGEQRSLTSFSYKAVSGDSDHLEIENSFSVRSLTGEPIFSVTRLYGINTHNGMHVAGSGDKDRSGYLFAPRMKGVAAQAKDKSSFEYWHVNYDTPAEMTYESESDLYGLRVYHYVSDFTADQTKDLSGVLPEVGITRGIGLDVHLELWVEPYTGRIVQYQDKTDAYYYDLATKERLQPWNSFRNQTDPASAAEQAKALSILKQKFNPLAFGVSAFLVLISILCLFFPYIKRSVASVVERSNGTGRTFLLPSAAAILVLLFSISLSYIASGITGQQTEAEFHAEASRIKESVSDRLGLYANVLRGGRGLFDASTEVSREEWKAYTGSLALQKDYPGIQGLGFSMVVKPDEKDEFVKSVQEEGFPDFSITPSGDRDIYTSIIYLEPFDARNQRAFGFDMFSEPTRREAMTYARDTGSVSVSKKVTLLQESSTDKQAGFLMYEAVYKPADTIYGYVYAPFRMNNFMSGIFSEGGTKLKVEIFDGADKENLSEERLMYRNDVGVERPLFISVETIEVYNQSWTIRFSAPQGYGYDIVRGSIPALVMVFGVLLSMLLFSVVYVVNTRRAKAVSLAKAMTSDLERSKREVEEKADVAERLNAVMVDRELKMVEMKKELEKLRHEK